MRTRYILSVLIVLAGVFMLVESHAFSDSTAADVGLAGGIALTVAALAALARGLGDERAAFAQLAVAGLALGVWTIVVGAGLFSDEAAKWIIFGNGGGALLLGLASLTFHELTSERVVHSLEVPEREVAQPEHMDREPVAAA